MKCELCKSDGPLRTNQVSDLSWIWVCIWCDKNDLFAWPTGEFLSTIGGDCYLFSGDISRDIEVALDD